MASQDQAFSYTPKALSSLELSISSERLKPYLTMANGHAKTAILFYERNTYLSEALYGVTQAAEVAIRNAIHRTLSTARGPMWFDAIGLSDPQGEMVSNAKYEIGNKGRIVTPGRIVAELNLGFWTSLLSAKYEKALWVPYLHKTFLNAVLVKKDGDGNESKIRLDRADIHGRLGDIKNLRNRIAHHESILKLDLKKIYEQTLDALGWVCETSAQWVRSTNCFLERIARSEPQPPKMVIPREAPKPTPGAPIRPPLKA